MTHQQFDDDQDLNLDDNNLDDELGGEDELEDEFTDAEAGTDDLDDELDLSDEGEDQ